MRRASAPVFVAALAALTGSALPGARATLVSSHVFSNHKGGCGKTTILFHAACEAAHSQSERILVVDTTLRGDLSELLLGGDKEAAGKQAVRAVGHLRSTTKLFMQAAAHHAAREGAGEASNSLVAKLFKGAAATKTLLDLDDQLIRVHDFNPAIPDNLYLCPGGSGPQTSYPLLQRQAIAETLRECLSASSAAWRLMCDTDGDQGFSDYTKIAHGLCDSVIVPLKTNVNDFSNRCVPMMEELFLARQAGEARSRIQMIVWNEVDVYKNAASTVSGLITPPKAAQGVINMLNALVAEVAATYPDLFHHLPPESLDDIEEFVSASTFCVRAFGVTGLAAAEHGIPFCAMREGKLQGGRLVYDIAAERLDQLEQNVLDLVGRLCHHTPLA